MSLGKTFKGMAKKLGDMEKEPASKEWFAKHAKSNALHEKKEGNKGEKKEHKLEAQSKKAGFYVHGHKNFGDVYEK